jgi:hypothetical protein
MQTSSAAAGRADTCGWVGEPDAMTVAVTTQGYATARTTVDGQPAQRPRHPGRWRALWVSLFAAFMTLLDTSIVNVALPSIERDLGAAAASAQWVISGYALAFGLVLVRPDGWATPSAGAGCSCSHCRRSWSPALSGAARRPGC